MKIGISNAGWLWQLALLSKPLPAAQGGKGGDSSLAGKVRIEQADGKPMLIATDWHCLTVVRDDHGVCENLAEPITLHVDGGLKRMLSKLGVKCRPAHDLWISDEVDPDDEETSSLGIWTCGSRADELPPEDAMAAVVRTKRFPAWRRILPSPERLAESWQSIAADGLERIKGINPALLAKLPSFGGGAILPVPVMIGGGSDRSVFCYVVRESGFEDRSVSIMMPMTDECRLPVVLPEFCHEEQADD